jgi:hypothetical protein
MFILDSLMIAGIRWALETTLTAAEAEMNDDTALRERLLEMELQREMGEITDQQFAAAEADVLARIRAIKTRREGGSQPLDLTGGGAIDTSQDIGFKVEASVSGDFHDPADAPHTTVGAEEAGPSTRTVRTTRTDRTDRTDRPARTDRPGRTVRAFRTPKKP